MGCLHYLQIIMVICMCSAQLSLVCVFVALPVLNLVCFPAV